MSEATTDLAQTYAKVVKKRIVYLGLFLFALILGFLIDISVGPSGMPIGDVVQGLLQPSSLDSTERIILWEIRLPYSLLAVLVGIALGLAGAEMQTVLRNSLASPYTLGLSSAATLGASIAMVLNWNPGGVQESVLVPLFAFAFSLGACLIVQSAAKWLGNGVSPIVLLGISMYFVCHALVAFIQFIADANSVQQIVFWTMGGLGRSTWPKLAILFGVIIFVSIFSIRRVWQMTALKAGEEQALSTGIDVDRMRFFVLMGASLLAAVAVSFAGAIGFIGLVGPHISRLVFGEDHRFYLPGSAIAGALVLSFASIASKVLTTGVIIPVGIVTALVGIPLFMVLIFTQRRHL